MADLVPVYFDRCTPLRLLFLWSRITLNVEYRWAERDRCGLNPNPEWFDLQLMK